MPSTYSPNFNLELQATGENTGTWGQRLNLYALSILDGALGNTLSLPLTNVNVTLNTAQSQNNFIDLSGTLTGNVSIIFPQIGRTYFVRNGTTGAFNVTLRTSAVGGVTYVLQQGQSRFIVLNGTDVLIPTDGVGALWTMASAATTDLGTAPSQNINITGTASISSFGSSAKAASPFYQLTFAGAATLVYNATSMILPGGGNIYVQAGDTATALYLGSGNWMIADYQASGYIPGVQPIAGGFRNLVATVTSDTSITLTADALTLEDSFGRAYRARNVNITASLAVSGAGGLDTGSETPNTWYSFWPIYNQSTNNLTLLLSTSATAPTLPSGYTFRARNGWVRNDASSNLWRTLQKGNRAQIVIGTNPTASPVVASGTNGNPVGPIWATIATGNFVPSTASSIRGTMLNAQSDNTRAILAPNSNYGAWNAANAAPVGNGNNGITGSFIIVNEQFDIVLESTNIYYASNNSGTNVLLNGWIDNI